MGIIGEVIGTPLGWLMHLIYLIVDNYGLSIVIFTLVTKLILVPVSVKQQKSQAAMAAFSPKLEELKRKYKNNQQKLNEEQMKLYSEEGINPMASCLPLVLQLLILYGVFDVIYRPLTHILRVSQDVIVKATELATTAFPDEKMLASRPEMALIQIAKDPEKSHIFNSIPDFVDQAQSFNNSLFGFIDLGITPSFKPEVWNAAAIGLFLIPIFSGLIQLIMTIYMQKRQKSQGAKMPQGMAGMNAVMYIMPLFSVWIAFSYPAGIGFYWTMSSLFSLIQTIVLYKIYTPEYVAELVERDKARKKKRNKGRPTMAEKYQKYVEAQQGLVEAKGTVKEDEKELTEDQKLSKSKQRELERAIIREARRRQAEKYGEEFIDDDDDDK